MNGWRQARSGFRTESTGNRLKSRSALQNLVTPCARHLAAILASWTIGPTTMPADNSRFKISQPQAAVRFDVACLRWGRRALAPACTAVFPEQVEHVSLCQAELLCSSCSSDVGRAFLVAKNLCQESSNRGRRHPGGRDVSLPLAMGFQRLTSITRKCRPQGRRAWAHQRLPRERPDAALWRWGAGRRGGMELAPGRRTAIAGSIGSTSMP